MSHGPMTPTEFRKRLVALGLAASIDTLGRDEAEAIAALIGCSVSQVWRYAAGDRTIAPGAAQIIRYLCGAEITPALFLAGVAAAPRVRA